MKTEKEIKDKIKELKEMMAHVKSQVFINGYAVNSIGGQIKILNWILGEDE